MSVLALLDGHSLAYRAFFALPQDLQTRSGQLTNSVYGFTSMLIKMLDDHRPDAVAVAWDSGRATFRTDRYPDYKAQRESAPDAFRSQLPLIREVLEALGIAQLELPGYEADDLIATLAARAEKEDWQVLIVSGDRDVFQLIDDHVRVLYTRRGISDTVLADVAWVAERYGIIPSHYADYAALRGDPSDNLPGVPGVGEKTASRLVSRYGNLEEIYDHLEDLTPKLRQALDEHRDQAFLNRSLMTLTTDLDLDLEFVESPPLPQDRAPVKQVFETLEFFSLWDRLVDLEESTEETLSVEVLAATSPAALEGLESGDLVIVQAVLEGSDLVGMMLTVSDAVATFIPVERMSLVEGVVTDPARSKATHDAKRLIRALSSVGIRPPGLDFDVAVAAYLVNPGSRSYDLPELASRFLGISLDPAPEEQDEGQGAFDLEGPDLERVAREAAAVFLLVPILEAHLRDRDEMDLFRDIEMPLVEVLARMEDNGIRVDRAYLENLGESLRDQLTTLQQAIYADAGEPFNINSTLQLREVLYERLGLPVLRKTAKGVPSTDAAVLSKLADAHPIVEHLLEYRELEKLRSTYVDGYLPLIGPDGRIHARFNQMGSTTGRLSSEQPNLQNIPVRSESGITIRRAFIPEAGWTFVVGDYSQIELRILAHMSADTALAAAFSIDDADIHAATAAKVFDVAPEHVTPHMRRTAKMINFGLIYGMEAFGLADRLEISREEAEAYITQYFAQFPAVQDFRKQVVEEARARGYTTTAFGRRRYLPELSSDNYRIRQMGERMALNAPIQGTAADIIKKAMIELDAELGERESRLLLQIHDELVLEAPPEELEEVVESTKRVMEGAARLAVPLRVDIGIGKDLADTKP